MTVEELEVAEEKSMAKIRDAMEMIFREINHMGNEENVEKAAVNEFLNQHRTLQQLFFKHIVCGVVKGLASAHKDRFSDLRNEASCECATELLPIINKNHFPFI